MKKYSKLRLVIIAVFMMLVCVGCASEEVGNMASEALEKLEDVVPVESNEPDLYEEDKEGNKNNDDNEGRDIEYSGKAYDVVNNNIPKFSKSDFKSQSFEHYGELDSLGRCSVAMANIGKDLMPTGERGAIGSVKPTGWHTVKYDCVDGKYLYNRCHLIGFQLTGENANERNLITGTRYMNVDGMLPFEDMVADYIKETSNHVLYRVTPKYKGDNLVATAVQMEAKSVEDNGDGICFNVMVYNIQPGVSIDYATGKSKLSDSKESDIVRPTIKAYSDRNSNESKNNNEELENVSTYILNKNNKKYHKPDCSAVSKMSEKNKEKYKGTAKSLEKEGYTPCELCD